MANFKQFCAIFQKNTQRCVEQKFHLLSSATRSSILYNQRHEKQIFIFNSRTSFMETPGKESNEQGLNKQETQQQTDAPRSISEDRDQINTNSNIKYSRQALDKLVSSPNIHNKKLCAIIHKSAALVVSEEVLTAHAEGKPVVALESAIITHGMSSPDNLVVAMKLEATIREKVKIIASYPVGIVNFMTH